MYSCICHCVVRLLAAEVTTYMKLLQQKEKPSWLACQQNSEKMSGLKEVSLPHILLCFYF